VRQLQDQLSSERMSRAAELANIKQELEDKLR
jgi:hypothetical protein